MALARAVVGEPDLLLLDEPLSALDPDTRGQVRHELASLLNALGLTTVLVTHDRDDAFELADRVAVLLNGRVAQVDAPAVAFERPADVEVARFLGLATLDGTVDRDGVVRVGELHVPLARSGDAGPVTLAVPPARLSLARAGAGGAWVPALPARVLRRRYVGGAWRVQLLPHGQSRAIAVETARDPGPDDLSLVLDPPTLHVIRTPRPFTVLD